MYSWGCPLTKTIKKKNYLWQILDFPSLSILSLHILTITITIQVTWTWTYQLLFSFETWYTCSSQWKEVIPLFSIFFMMFLRDCFKISGSHFPIWNYLANGSMNLRWISLKIDHKLPSRHTHDFRPFSQPSKNYGTLLVHDYRRSELSEDTT